jgi:hypothetical protein
MIVFKVTLKKYQTDKDTRGRTTEENRIFVYKSINDTIK